MELIPKIFIILAVLGLGIPIAGIYIDYYVFHLLGYGNHPTLISDRFSKS